MTDTIYNSWEIFSVVLLGIVYLGVILNQSRKQQRPRKLNEAELLAKLALISPDTEFDIFRMAAQEWHVPESRISDDFKGYLLEGLIPYYVNSYLRKFARENGDIYQSPFVASGRGSMPWLK